MRVPHVKIRKGLIEDHLADGWMDEQMFTAYAIMLHTCDWATGIWLGSADRLVAATGYQWSQRTAERVLERLCAGRYITSGHVRGHKGNYPVFINNFVPTCGPDKDKKLRPTQTINWKSADKTNDAKVATLVEVPTKVSPKVPTQVASNQECVPQDPEASLPTVVQEEKNNNNRCVVVESSSGNGLGQEKQDQDDLVAGHSQQEIAEQSEACKANPWVRKNDSPNARKREGFVRHLMSLDPPKADGTKPQYQQGGKQWL